MEELASAPQRHKGLKALKIVAAIILALLFIASLVFSVLIGGELLEKPAIDNRTKGLIRLESPNYQQEYFEGDPLVFDKDRNQVTLVAKDPALENIVKIDDLPGPEYGFKVRKLFDEEGNRVDPEDIEENALLKPKEEQETEKKSAIRLRAADEEVQTGESEEGTEGSESEEEEEIPVYFYEDTPFSEQASGIKATKDMGTVYLVSKRYQDLMLPLDIEVLNGKLDETGLVNSQLMEAEKADVYLDDELLTEEDLATKPDENKPFDSSKGTTVAGEDCSGGACLRSFGSNNMKVDFLLVSSKAVDIELTIKVCKRPKAGQFDSFYKFTVNGVAYEEISSQEIPAGSSGQYYEPHDMEKVTVHIQRGVNHLTFASGSSVGTSSPVNLDGILVTSTENVLGTMANIVA